MATEQGHQKVMNPLLLSSRTIQKAMMGVDVDQTPTQGSPKTAPNKVESAFDPCTIPHLTQLFAGWFFDSTLLVRS